MGRVVQSLKHGWNVFQKPPETMNFSAGSVMKSRQNRQPSRFYADKSIVRAIQTRLAVDLAQIEFFHAKLDENDVAIEIVKDSLNDCLTLDANVDQTAQALKIDWALTLFEDGESALVPTDASLDPSVSSSYDIRTMRVGNVMSHHPRNVTLMVYDDREYDDDGKPVNGGISKQITLPKAHVALVENPFYNVMNEPNGTLQRLKAKLSLMDGIDEAASSGKLDLIFQLPYTVRGDSRRAQAEKRRQDLRDQLKDDELGIGYIDVSEKVIQLNRPVNNKLLEEIKELQDAVYAELGLTREIMNGTADRDAINNYYDRTIDPIAEALRQEVKRKFLTKTARSQKHSIEIYRDPLKTIPIAELGETTDKLIRNAVLTANEIRPKIGYRPSKQAGANELRNPNMPTEDQVPAAPQPPAKEVASGNQELPRQPEA